MKKSLIVLLLISTGRANANVVPIDTLQVFYEVYAKLNTCHQLGYISDDVLGGLDDVIQRNKYQDNLGNISSVTQDNISYYHSLRDKEIYNLQDYSNNTEQSGMRSHIKLVCDQLNARMGSKLGIQAMVIPSEKLPASAKSITNEDAENNSGELPPEDRAVEWENSPVGGVNFSMNSEGFYLDEVPDGLEVLDTPGLYIKSSVDSDGVYQIDGLYELYKPKPAPGTDEILNHPFYGCGDMVQEPVDVTEVTSGGNQNTVQTFKVRHDNGTTTVIPFGIWLHAMNQVQKNSASTLIIKGKRLRIYYQSCGNGGIETIRGIEEI